MNIFRETSQVFCYTISHKNESDFFSLLIIELFIVFFTKIQKVEANFELLYIVFQVVDLDEMKMEAGLKWFQLLDEYNIQSYIIVAGGDGTVG